VSISEYCVESYLRDGYVILERVLSPELLAAALQAFERVYPTWEEYQSGARSLRDGSGPIGDVHGPFSETALNAVATHPTLLAFARRVIGVSSLSLRNSHLSAKYYGFADYDQFHHCDFGMHTLTYPRDDSTYHILAAIVYYTDVSLELGPTCVLPHDVTRRQFETPFAGRSGVGRSPFGGSNLRWQLVRSEHPQLYEQEVPVIVPAGSALLYNIRTFHRGTAFSGEGARFAHFLTYYSANHAWTGLQGWGRFGAEEGMQHFLSSATPPERELVGFPGPGDPFWNEETLRGVAARYPAMDMTPYRTATPGAHDRGRA
jgi:ectoine hydroxylase-related dioxygenase (phytanoyl-CoA dioxygenase family)